MRQRASVGTGAGAGVGVEGDGDGASGPVEPDNRSEFLIFAPIALFM